MTVLIDVNGTEYEVPSNASDTNWAAKQIAFQQALAAAVGQSGGSGDAINAFDYGLRTTNTGTQNNIAMELAIAAAVDEGKQLFIPSGTFKMNFHGIGSEGQVYGAMILEDSITINGAGKDQTILVCDGFVEGIITSKLDFNTQTSNFTIGDTITGATSGATGVLLSQIDSGATGTLTLQGVDGLFQAAETITDQHGGSAKATAAQYNTGIATHNDDSRAMFMRPAGTQDVTIANMTLQGPPPADLTHDLNLCWAYWSGGGGKLNLVNVDMTLWNQCGTCAPNYPSYPGLGTNFTALNCYFGYRSSNGPQHTDGTDANYDSANFVDCTFEFDDEGQPTITDYPVSNGQYPNFYINRGVSISTTRCHFKKAGHGTFHTATSIGWLHFGNSNNDVALYAQCIDCIFYKELGEVQMYASAVIPTQVNGCQFNTGVDFNAIQVAGPMSLTGCNFTPEDGADIGIQPISDAPLSAVNCFFGNPGQADGYASQIQRSDPASSEWLFSTCTFHDVEDSAGIQVVHTSTGKTVFDNCTFNASTGIYAVTVQGGHVVLTDCRMDGLPIIAGGNSADCILEMNSLRCGTSAQIQVQGTSGNAVELRGSDNLFFETSPGLDEGISIVSATGVDNITGNLLFRQGIGSYTYNAGSDTLTVGFNHDTIEFNEGSTPPIETITTTGNSAMGVTADDHNRYHNGRLYIRAVQDFSFSNAGNIVPLNTSTRAVGSMAVLQYFPNAVKWYEI